MLADFTVPRLQIDVGRHDESWTAAAVTPGDDSLPHNVRISSASLSPEAPTSATSSFANLGGGDHRSYSRNGRASTDGFMSAVASPTHSESGRQFSFDALLAQAVSRRKPHHLDCLDDELARDHRDNRDGEDDDEKRDTRTTDGLGSGGGMDVDSEERLHNGHWDQHRRPRRAIATSKRISTTVRRDIPLTSREKAAMRAHQQRYQAA